MKIDKDYFGSSIKILKENKEKNTIEVSLREEKNSYGHYYNFKVINNEEKEGIIIIKNIDKSAYYSKKSQFYPYIKKENDENWERAKNNKVTLNENEITIKIEANEKIEISTVPRYVQKDLELFINEKLKKFKDKGKLKYENKVIPKLEFGNKGKELFVVIGRQHPGETLSSFFIEGMIEEIINNKNMLDSYNYLFFPIVNKQGVEKGNHRYINGVDLNRSWNKKDRPEEIKYILDEIGKRKVKNFIDIHNDEISVKDYIRTNKKMNREEIGGIPILKTMTRIRRFLRALIKQHKIIKFNDLTAREYVQKKYKCDSLLIELSMNTDYKKIKNKGQKFTKEIIGSII